MITLILYRGKPDANTGTRNGETSHFGKPGVCLLPNPSKKVLHFNRSVAQSSFQGVTIHLRMERKHTASSIRVLHLDVASLAMDFLKTEPL